MQYMKDNEGSEMRSTGAGGGEEEEREFMFSTNYSN